MCLLALPHAMFAVFSQDSQTWHVGQSTVFVLSCQYQFALLVAVHHVTREDIAQSRIICRPDLLCLQSAVSYTQKMLGQAYTQASELLQGASRSRKPQQEL